LIEEAGKVTGDEEDHESAWETGLDSSEDLSDQSEGKKTQHHEYQEKYLDDNDIERQ
jgi:hypothetical protein